MPTRILLVEDDAEISQFTAQGLREEGFEVECERDGRKAQTRLLDESWDLVLLDWWLPGRDGKLLLEGLRASGRTTPVLFLTARDAVEQRIEGLNAGADDYLCKPFAFGELLARVQALLRRRPGGPDVLLQFEDVVLNVSANVAERAGKILSLTTREQALLQFFLRHPRTVLTRARLYEQVWQEQFDGLSNTLEVHVMELRRKLEAHGERIIQTVRGQGYMLARSGEATP